MARRHTQPPNRRQRAGTEVFTTHVPAVAILRSVLLNRPCLQQLKGTIQQAPIKRLAENPS